MTIDMSLFEPITRNNIHELEPGEWIWDNAQINRREHRRSLWPESIVEPIGFRQIHIIDPSSIPMSKPFMLSTIDGRHHYYSWEYFSENRYYRFKRRKLDDIQQTRKEQNS